MIITDYYYFIFQLLDIVLDEIKLIAKDPRIHVKSYHLYPV